MMSPILSGCCASAGGAASSAAQTKCRAQCARYANRMMSSRRGEMPVIGRADAELMVARQRKDAPPFVKPPDRLTSPDMLSGDTDPPEKAAMPKRKTGRKSAPQAAAGPLAGIGIVDMSTVLMGPYATQIMADYGADVVKLEPPEGDIMRHGGPMRNPRMGPMYLQANRNKRSIVVDIKTAGGRDVLRRLCASADVFICNVRPAAMRRLGLGPDDIRAA